MLDRNCELKKYTNYHKHFAPVLYRGEAVSAENLIGKFEEFQYNENTGLKEVESGSS